MRAPRHIRLGVNIDHVATLRNARGGTRPDPLEAARAAMMAGADGITLHVREDRRHIRDEDFLRIRNDIAAPVNLELAATEEMLALALRGRPHACCIVPERRAELTTEGGLDAAGGAAQLTPIVGALAAAGIRVSLFIDPEPDQLAAAAVLGAHAVELHTGRYAEGLPGELDRLRAAAARTAALGLECHAGHGLTLANVGAVAAIPEIRELNIGHFLIGEAILTGLAEAVRRMRTAIEVAT